MCFFQVGGFKTHRDRAASVAVGDQILILGGKKFREIKFFFVYKKNIFLGKDVDDQDIIGFEVYDNKLDEWNPVPEWQMAQGRYRY